MLDQLLPFVASFLIVGVPFLLVVGTSCLISATLGKWRGKQMVRGAWAWGAFGPIGWMVVLVIRQSEIAAVFQRADDDD